MGYDKSNSQLRQSYGTEEDDDDDDDDVVIGSSASLSRFREQDDNNENRRRQKSSSPRRASKSRDPTIYRDPEKQSGGEWYQNKNKSRDSNRTSISQYLDENEREEAERRRKLDDVRKNSRSSHQLGKTIILAKNKLKLN